MLNPRVSYRIRNIRGNYQPMSLFQFFDDGIRKRLPKLVAEDFKEEILQNINNNTFGFVLSKRWLRYKEFRGADSRPYIMFKHYKNAISVVTTDGHLAVGFKRSAMHPRAGISMGKLAIMLEYGDALKGIPARPIWRKTAQKFFREQKAGLVKKIAEAIKDTNNTK